MSTNENASNEAGANVVALPGKTTKKNARKEYSTGEAILESRSTSITVQMAKLIELLRQKPHTTFELRDNGICMPAARVFQIKRAGHVIETELVDQYDSGGYLHIRCARYHLVQLAGIETDYHG